MEDMSEEGDRQLEPISPAANIPSPGILSQKLYSGQELGS